MGPEEAVEAGGGHTHAPDEGEHVFEGVDVFAEFDEAAQVDAQDGDLAVEAGKLEGVKVSEVSFFDLAGVEAVLESIKVSGLTAGGAARLGIVRLVVHASFVAQMFGVVKC